MSGLSSRLCPDTTETVPKTIEAVPIKINYIIKTCMFHQSLIDHLSFNKNNTKITVLI